MCELDSYEIRHIRQHRSNRRNFLYLAGLSAFGLGIKPTIATASSGEEIVQPAAPDDATFIERAFEMRQIATERGDQPYGAVVVREGRIIGQSWSRVIIDNDPTAHAEMAAIRDAARRQGDRNLAGSILYSSSRPCPMCEAGAYWARVESMIHGREWSDAGRPSLCR